MKGWMNKKSTKCEYRKRSKNGSQKKKKVMKFLKIKIKSNKQKVWMNERREKRKIEVKEENNVQMNEWMNEWNNEMQIKKIEEIKKEKAEKRIKIEE